MKINCCEITVVFIKEVQKELLGEEIEQFYCEISSVFQFEGGCIWTGNHQTVAWAASTGFLYYGFGKC